MENTQNTEQAADERTFSKWLTEFRYFVETSGYREVLDEKALQNHYYDVEVSGHDAAVDFLRSKGL
jgi:hypothetical protein